MTDTSGSKTRLGRTVRTLLKVRREANLPLLVGTVTLVFLSIFTKSQASSTFEAMNSAHLSMCQKDVRPSVQKWWRLWLSIGSEQGIRLSLHHVR